ncbi:MAG: helix-turn-helix domain-containing protein [Haloferacaceae archaeon]
MPTAKLDITLPESVWVRDVSVAHPDATFTVLAALGGDEEGVGLLEVGSDDPGDVLADVETADGVTAIEPLRVAEREALVQFETTEPRLLTVVQSSGIPLEPPVTIVDGTASLEVTASRDRLSALADQLDAVGMPFDVKYVRQTVDAGELLTEGQREILTRAVDLGYYDTPRECTLTELADALGVAKSTASERLHRAEEKAIKSFVADTLEIDREPPRID